MPKDPSFPAVRFVRDFSEIRLPKPRVVVCDRRLPPWVRRHFRGALLVTGGEGVKSLSRVEKLAAVVLARGADRSLTLVAVGGGSVGDAVGFLSSILWRGVGLVHVPTTLLAMADSAHGGKTAVNLPSAKNQLGTFYPAKEVWIVRSLVNRMPAPLVREGLSEIVKSALVGDRVLAGEYLRRGPGVNVWRALRRAIAVKRKICSRDPRETKGIREVLNLGHTFGHALEITSGLSHGRAVAWGLACAAVVSSRFGFGDTQEVLDLLRPLLVRRSGWPSDRALVQAMRWDKKRKDASFRSVVLRDVGKPVVTSALYPRDWIKAWHEARRRIHG